MAFNLFKQLSRLSKFQQTLVICLKVKDTYNDVCLPEP